jgi:DnaJ-class molecular chaperone
MKDAIILLEEIQKEEKRHRKKDYYKILEVSNNANDQDLRKGFKKLASKWHPDKNTGSDEQREIAEKLFKDINEAYTVLGDPEKRRVYDLGGDPNDPDFMSAHQQTYKPYEPTLVYKYNTEEKDSKSKKKSKRDRKTGFH